MKTYYIRIKLPNYGDDSVVWQITEDLLKTRLLKKPKNHPGFSSGDAIYSGQWSIIPRKNFFTFKNNHLVTMDIITEREAFIEIL
jgi:hypothetical protein